MLQKSYHIGSRFILLVHISTSRYFFEIFFAFLVQNPLSLDLGIQRDGKGVIRVYTPRDKEERYERQFHNYIMKVLNNEIRRYGKEQQQALQQTVRICDVNETALQMDATYFEWDCVYAFENQLLIEAFIRLQPKQQMILKHFYCFGQTDRQIAKLLQMPGSTVNYTRNRALKQLKQYMEDHGE